MMHCRMCSQRLTRPGRLCRECEHELERAQVAGVSVHGLDSSVPLIDASRMAGTAHGIGRLARLRSRGPVIAVAFAIGLVGAAALHMAQRSSVAATPRSVMLDRDISRVRPRSFTPVASQATATETLVTQTPVTQVSDAAPINGGTQAPSINDPRTPSAVHRVTLPVQPTSTSNGVRRQGGAPERFSVAVPESRPRIATAASPREAPAAYDRALAFSDALARCGDETYFARVACEQRARIRYCDAVAAQAQQCAEEAPRDHGQ